MATAQFLRRLLSEATWLRRAAFAVFASLRRLARYSKTPMRPAISTMTMRYLRGAPRGAVEFSRSGPGRFSA